MKNILILLGLVISIASCKSSKTAVTAQQFQSVKDLVAQKQFEFVADWAFPLSSNALNQISNAGLLGIGNNSGRINLLGNPNYIRFENDSISGYLPFYGERQISSFNSTDTAISLNGIPQDYEEVVNEDKKSIDIKFRISDRTESYQVFISIFGNRTARVSFNSSQRNAIRYDGDINIIEEKE